MHLIVFILLSVMLKFNISRAEISIAVIGGGIGGASTAFFLNEMKQKEIKIDLYEGKEIGGRLATIEYKGRHYEVGGSIIHSKNLLMKQFVEKFGLEAKQPCSDDFGIFDGKKMLFKSSRYNFITALKLWWRYGNDIITMNSYTGDMIDSFSRLYDLEECSTCPFKSTADILSYAGEDLLESLNVSTRNGLKSRGLSEKFIDEFISCIIRCNYCQSTDVHLFVGSVAVAGAGSALWSVKGGNWQVAAKLIKASEANLIREQVLSVSSVQDSNRINVTTSSGNNLYDYVVIATPLTDQSGLAFHGFNGKTVARENFHLTVCTIIDGEINASFFGSGEDSVPDIILLSRKFRINAISKINPVSGDCDNSNEIWKIFSDSALSDSELSKIFKDYSVVSIKHWLAYPEYGSTGTNKSFYLFDGVTNVLYVNAIEALASAMEMSALGGRNVASLITKNIFNKKNPQQNLNKTHHDEF